MIFAVIAAFVAVVGLLVEIFADGDNEGVGIGITLFVAPLILIVFSLMPTCFAWVHQNQDEANIQRFVANEQIYQNKANTITSELNNLLAVQYPNLEQNVLNNLAKNPNLLFIQFPQLRSSETFTTLANRYQQLEGAVFTQQTNITKAKSHIRARQKNPFYLQFLVPNH